MYLRKSKVFRFFLLLSLLAWLCEYGIYYLVIFQCRWPTSENPYHVNFENETLKAMFVADLHLLGPIRGHWFDRLRREWQMYRSFQTAIQLFQPEVVFFLGDIFDEGQWVTSEHFDNYVERFKSMFSVPESARSYVVVGNHDTGFHYVITPELKGRFEAAFKTTPVKQVRLKEINFVLINSMAMEGDGCFLCGPAVSKIQKIAGELECDQNPSDQRCRSIDRPKSKKVKAYSQPIILQHFPMYRESDASCMGDDAAPGSEKRKPFRLKIDCLSESSSQMLLRTLKPRLIISGHTHFGCLYNHEIRGAESVPEYSVPSFSWRNINNPSFFLGRFTKDDFQLEKCRMPRETTVIRVYIFGSILIILYSLGILQRRFVSSMRHSIARFAFHQRRLRD